MEYDRINMSEGIGVNKTNGSRECIICLDWHFLEVNFKFQPEVCNGCQDLMQKAMNFNDVAIPYLKEMITESIFALNKFCHKFIKKY